MQSRAAVFSNSLRPRILYTWTPKVCKIMALVAVILGLGLLFYILLGFRHELRTEFSLGGGSVGDYKGFWGGPP